MLVLLDQPPDLHLPRREDSRQQYYFPRLYFSPTIADGAPTDRPNLELSHFFTTFPKRFFIYLSEPWTEYHVIIYRWNRLVEADPTVLSASRSGHFAGSSSRPSSKLFLYVSLCISACTHVFLCLHSQTHLVVHFPGGLPFPLGNRG